MSWNTMIICSQQWHQVGLEPAALSLYVSLQRFLKDHKIMSMLDTSITIQRSISETTAGLPQILPSVHITFFLIKIFKRLHLMVKLFAQFLSRTLMLPRYRQCCVIQVTGHASVAKLPVHIDYELESVHTVILFDCKNFVQDTISQWVCSLHT